jgi:hypothetical protein
MGNVLVIDKVPPPGGGVFAGHVKLPERAPEAYQGIAILPFLWTESADELGWPRGWKPATSNGIPLRRDGTWFVQVAAARQYGVLMQMSGFELELNSSDPFEPGTLPEGFYVELCVAADVKVMILGAPEVLHGLITGLPHGLEPHQERHIRVVAWAKKDGATTFIRAGQLEPNMYWSFPIFDAEAWNADEYAVAIVKESFEATHAVPPIGGDVIDLTWRRVRRPEAR